jgi:chemotaxis protein CheD
MEQIITVGLGEIAVSRQRDAVLTAFGLGSCVAVAAYDPLLKAGGMLHALLPVHRNGDRNLAKFVDTGVEEVLRQLLALGAERDRLYWWVVGGAQMLTMAGLNDRFNIGAQNVAAAQAALARQGLRLAGHDTGGHEGRTVRLHIATGVVLVRTVNGTQRTLSEAR